MCAEAEAPSALRADRSGGRSGKVMCPHLCAICFHDTGCFSAPPLIRLSSGSQSLGGISAPVPPRACLLASMWLWKGSWPAGGGGQWAVGAPFLTEHEVEGMPRGPSATTYRCWCPGWPGRKCPGPKRPASMRTRWMAQQQKCRRDKTAVHTPGNTQSPRARRNVAMSLGLGETRLRTAALLTRQTVRLMPASVHRGSRCQRGAAGHQCGPAQPPEPAPRAHAR